MSEIAATLSRKTAKALLTFRMIEAGDRVLVGASGGKDSTSLVYHLALKRQTFTTPFDIEALHIHTEYCRCDDELWSTMQSWGVAVHRREVSIQRRLKEGKTMNCYWCATQRRTEMLKFAEKHEFKKIALGHHMDDIIETFFMNMLYKGELSTMLPVMSYDKYEQDIIRPFSLVKEAEIIEFASWLGIRRVSCSCNHDSRSKRREARGYIERIAAGRSFIKENIFKSMSEPILRYLMVEERSPRDGL